MQTEIRITIRKNTQTGKSPLTGEKRAAAFSGAVNKRRASLWETSWMHSMCTGTYINQEFIVLPLLGPFKPAQQGKPKSGKLTATSVRHMGTCKT